MAVVGGQRGYELECEVGAGRENVVQLREDVLGGFYLGTCHC